MVRRWRMELRFEERFEARVGDIGISGFSSE